MVWSAVQQTWAPFVLVVGLLLIGHLAAAEGVFEAIGSHVSRLPGGSITLFIAMMLVTALVTATMNLDTSVVFLTPVLLHAARHRKIDERAFLYGSIFMANAASLLLLGSNLTNVLVFANSGVKGSVFARTMLPSWLVSIALTTLVVMLWRWRELRISAPSERARPQRIPLGLGLVGVAMATVLMLVLSRPALPVLAGALVLVLVERLAVRRIEFRNLVRSANLPVVVGLFTVATSVSVAARYWNLSERLLGHANTWQTAGIGALSANLINNLPASALLSAKFPSHPYSLLLGLNLGPNLAVIGALSTFLWRRVAESEGAKTSMWTFTKVGFFVTSATLVGALILI